jgi:hypothetical protein
MSVKKTKTCPWSVRVVTVKNWKLLACFKTMKPALASAKSRARKSRIKPGYGFPTFLLMRGGSRHRKVWKHADGSVVVQ